MDPRRIRLFWDSSAVVGTLMARSAGAPGRALMRLGEAGVVEMRLSQDVLQDAEWVFQRRHRSDLAAELVDALDRSRFEVVSEPNQETTSACAQWTGYWADARILAAAEECGADLLITTDKEHFIGNPLIGPPNTNCRAMTPYEALEWCRHSIREAQPPA